MPRGLLSRVQRADSRRAPRAGEPCARRQVGPRASGEGRLTRVLGAVLAGGRSSRFGSDKAAALFEGRRLVDHATAGIAPFVERVVTVGKDDVPDLPSSGLGPLGGITGALTYAAREGFESVLTTGCDMPRLPEGLLADLLRCAPAWCADAPVLGHWPASLAGPLLAYLDATESRSVRRWARSVGALPVTPRAPIANVNTVADLAAL